VLDGDARRHLDGPCRRLGLAFGLRPRRTALTPLGRLAPGLGVDDDPALALGRGAALRPRGTARLRRLVLRGRRRLRAELAPHFLVVYRFFRHVPVNPSTRHPAAQLPPAAPDRAALSPNIVAFSGSRPADGPGPRNPPPGTSTPPARAGACRSRRRARRPRPPSAPAHAAAGAGRSRRTGAPGRSPRRRAPLLGRGQRHVRRDAAVAAPVERLVRAALAGRRDRDAAARELVILALGAGVRLVGVVGVVLGLRDDVDPPPGQAMGQAGVQALLADRERELAVGHHHGRLAVVVVDVHLAHLGRRERLGDEPGRLVVPRDDVDLLAAQLRHDHAHTRPAGADAGADRIDALHARLDRDLGAIAGLAGDGADVHEAVGDLGHLELEQLPDELVGAAREHDLRPLALGPHLDDDGLDPAALLVALAGHLLGAGQDRLHAAEVDERVAVVVLLDDAGHDLADAVGVLVVHHRALGLVDALAQHLLGRLAGDAAEVVRGDVDEDVVGEPVPLDLGFRLFLDRLLAGHGRRLVDDGRLGQHVVVRVRVEIRRPGVVGHGPGREVAGVAVEVDPHR